MNSGPFSSRASRDQSISRHFALAVSAFALALSMGLSSLPARARADVPAASPTDRPGSVTHGHVFLVGPQGPVDVTSQIRTDGLQTYVVDSSGAWPIYIDSARGLVFDGAGAMIGYVDQS